MSLPIKGERWKRDEFTREVVEVRPPHGGYPGLVRYSIRYGNSSGVHAVSLPTWRKWAEKAKKEGS